MNLDLLMIVAIIYIILNCAALMLYGLDKRKAVKNKYRVSESALIWIGLIGPFGALVGMKAFRHKTQKTKFKLIYVFVILHIVIFALFIWKFML